MAETWVFNDTLQIPTNTILVSEDGFTSNGENFSGMSTTVSGALRFSGISGSTYMDVYKNGAWVTSLGDYKTVTFTVDQTGNFRAWLESNATLQTDTTVVEYLTTNADLKTVADAIRSKTGSTDALVFPDGFVTAIGNIPTGAYNITTTDNADGSQNLAIVDAGSGGALTPATLTINSSATITDSMRLSYIKPDGTVFVQVPVGSDSQRTLPMTINTVKGGLVYWEANSKDLCITSKAGCEVYNYNGVVSSLSSDPYGILVTDSTASITVRELD